MESHPEEDNNCEHHDKGGDALLGLLGSEFLDVGVGGSGLLCIDVCVLEPAAAGEVNGD